MPRTLLLQVMTAAGLTAVVAAPLTTSTSPAPVLAAETTAVGGATPAAPAVRDAATAVLSAAALRAALEQTRLVHAPRRARALPARASRSRRPVARRPAAPPRAIARHRVVRPAVPRTPQQYARAELAGRGQAGQFGCLDRLWTRESEWRTRSTNASSGAYGIPQALPARKMATSGADWRTNPRTQIRWGLGYIAARYGSPCGAWRHSQAHNWY